MVVLQISPNPRLSGYFQAQIIIFINDSTYLSPGGPRPMTLPVVQGASATKEVVGQGGRIETNIIYAKKSGYVMETLLSKLAIGRQFELG